MEIALKVEKYLKKNREKLFVFCSTVLLGLVVHIYMFTNKLYNYFEMNNILTEMSYDKGDTLAMGRWFLPIVSKISSVFSMPVINGLICLFCLGIIACLIVDMLEIKGRICGALVGAILVSFPGVASYLSYGVNSDVFSVALLLAVLSAWTLYKTKAVYIKKENDDEIGVVSVKLSNRVVGISASAILLALCIATYQPFMSVTIALIFARLFLDIWNDGIGIKAFFKKFVLYLLSLVVGFVIYYIVLKIFNAVMNIEVGDYHGINEMTSFSPKGIAKGFVYTYRYFAQYLFAGKYTGGFILAVWNGIVLCAFFFLAFAYKRTKNIACLIFLVIFMPLGVNACPFLMADRVGNGVDRYMMFSMMILFCLVIAMASRVEKEKLGPGVIYASILLAVICNAYIINQGYFRADAMTKSENNYLNRLVARIEEYDEYSSEVPVYLLGADKLFNENTYTNPLFEELPIIDGTEIKPWYNYDAVVKYLEVYMNFTVSKVDTEIQDELDARALECGSKLNEMPTYPRKGSMEMIDGVLVVKLSQPEAEVEE